MTENVITAVTGVFDAIANWLVSYIPIITGIFYNSTDGLSLLGVLAIVALSISVCFLILSFVVNFFQFRA